MEEVIVVETAASFLIGIPGIVLVFAVFLGDDLLGLK